MVLPECETEKEIGISACHRLPPWLSVAQQLNRLTLPAGSSGLLFPPGCREPLPGDRQDCRGISPVLQECRYAGQALPSAPGAALCLLTGWAGCSLLHLHSSGVRPVSRCLQQLYRIPTWVCTPGPLPASNAQGRKRKPLNPISAEGALKVRGMRGP